MKTYYEILEVDKNASINTIKKIYKYKIKLNHPDLFSGKEKLKAEKVTKELTEAYKTLSNDEKRKEYDNILNENNINNQIILEENTTLKQEIDLLKSELEKKDIIIESFLNPNEVKKISSFIDQSYKDINSSNKVNNSNSNSLIKDIFLNLIYFFKETFLKPMLTIIIMILICLFITFLIKI